MDHIYQILMLLRFVLVCVGAIYIVTRSAIFTVPRMTLGYFRITAALVYCPACMGFWIGFGLSALYWPYWYGLEAAVIACGIGSILFDYWGAEQVLDELRTLGHLPLEKQSEQPNDGSQEER